jgi:predicted transglutaminase-like cysteine proteinase
MGKLGILLVMWVVMTMAIGAIGCAVETVSTPTPTPTPSLSPTPTSTLTPTPTPTSTARMTPTATSAPTLTPTPNPSNPITPSAQSSAILERQYEWSFSQSVWTWSLNIPEALYDYYRNSPRPPTDNYSVYVTNPYDDEYLDKLVQKIREAATQAGFNEWETVNFAVSFVQSLPYTSDSVTTLYDEYPRYPIETLADSGGDCEDTSILMAAMLDAMGYGVVLLKLPIPDTQHMAVGVLGGQGVYGTYWEHNGGKYYYVETTGEGWKIGELPSEYVGKSARIYAIVPVSILTGKWEATPEGYYYKLRVTVQNPGTASAQDVYVQAGFDAGNGLFWNLKQSTTFNLEPNYWITVTIYTTPPINQHTRLIVQIVDDGYAVDRSYSEWFDT